VEDDLAEEMRLKFYGLNDYATFFQAERAGTVLAEFDRSRASYGVNDIVELHNASRFVEQRGCFRPRWFRRNGIGSCRWCRAFAGPRACSSIS